MNLSSRPAAGAVIAMASAARTTTLGSALFELDDMKGFSLKLFNKIPLRARRGPMAVLLHGQVDHLRALHPLSRARYIAHVRSMFALLQ